MQKKATINYGNFLLSLSDAIDLANPEIVQHQLRTAYISWEICQVADLHDEMVKDIFIASLYHDVGAITTEEKTLLHDFETDTLMKHCQKGELLLKRMPFFEKISKIVFYHHTNWEEINEPLETYHVISSQIVQLADYIERLIDRKKYILHQTEVIINEIKSQADKLVHSLVINYFLEVSKREDFWLDLVSDRLYSKLFRYGPLNSVEIDISKILTISKLFRDLIDFKSPFTATHTTGVSASAKIISELFGLTESEVKNMEIAGNFHDLGKLIIPNSILEKPDKLTKEEFEIIKCHTYYSYQIINSIRGMETIAEWAAYHHENLNGTGYPFHYSAGELTIGSRIMMVADIYTAISEDRPYRKGMDKEKIFSIFQDMVSKNNLDSKIVEVLLDNYEEINEQIRGIQLASFEFYNSRFSAI